LLCAVALRLNAGILTTDQDFERFARILPIKLHAPRRGLSV
jgi:predicted nucleic acid-binding protein